MSERYSLAGRLMTYTDAWPAMSDRGPILAIDVQYSEADVGYAAGVLFESSASSTPQHVFLHIHPNVSPYEAGAFYKRELPPVLALLEKSPVAPAVIIVDGFVDLDNPEHPGLGRHLYNRLGGRTAVIGVAKNPFRKFGDDKSAPPYQPHVGIVHRGSSSRALFVTAAGVSLADAVELVKGMDGAHRIPTLLKLVDSEARTACLKGSVST